MIFEIAFHTATSFEFIAGMISAASAYGTHRLIHRLVPSKLDNPKDILVTEEDQWRQAYAQANADLKAIEPNIKKIPKKRFTLDRGYLDVSCGRQICALGFGHAGLCVY